MIEMGAGFRFISILLISLAGITALSGPICAQEEEISETPVKILSLENWANDIEISPFGSFIAVASRDNHVRILDSGYKQLFIFRGRHDYPNSGVLGFTPDERFLAFAKYSSEQDIGLVDLETMEVSASLTGHTQKIYCFTVSPDGRFAASGAYNGELIVWKRTPEGFEEMQQINIPDEAIRKLVFSNDGGRLAVVFQSDTLDLYELGAGGVEFMQHLAPDQHYGNTGYLYGLDFSPDDRLLAAGMRNEITLWELKGGRYSVCQVIPEAGDTYIQCLEFSPGGGFFACGFGRGEVRFWKDLPKGWTEVKAISGKQDYVQDLEFSPDGKHLATGSRQGNTVIFRDITGIGADPKMELSAAAGIPFSRAQKRVITGDVGAGLLSRLDSSLAGPKDEFETGEEYEQRLNRLSGGAIRLLQEYTEDMYRVEELPGAPAGMQVRIPLEALLDYRIEEERYNLRFMNTRGYVTIPRNEARSLKQHMADAFIRADRSESTDGISHVYSGFALIHPVSGEAYKLNAHENPFRAVPVNTTSRLLYEKAIGPHLTIKNLVLNDIFPAFYRYYDGNAIGTAEIFNTGTAPVEDLHIDLVMQTYMDHPKECIVPAELGVNRSAELKLFALLNSKVLALSEGDTLSVKISVSYSAEGKDYTGEIIQSIRLLNRNAIMWDDDMKAAAFVTAKDPAILRYSKRVAGSLSEPEGSAFNKNLLQAMRIFEGLRASGLTYIVDPSTPYTDFSKTGTAIDFLQFPRQTLEYGAGDCDDLSVLYNALLESIGIGTAFITVPGHIYTAFDTGLSRREASKFFSNPGELIYTDDRAWVPVETTVLGEGFLHAWELGLGLYNRYSALEELNFFTTADAWARYEPVGIAEDGEIPVPDISAVKESYAAEIAKYREKEIFHKEQELLNGLSSDEDNIVLINKLGILYSRYGSYETALRQFEKALELENYLPAIMNKGNVHSILGDLGTASKYYALAAEEDPDNPRILLCLAMVKIEQGNLEEAEEIYGRIRKLDANLAKRFPLFGPAGSGDSTRAAAQDTAAEVFNLEWE